MVVIKPLWVDHGSGPIQNPDITQEEFDAGLIKMKEDNIQALWQAAHDYEYKYISGSATSMLVIGVMQQKPKSLEVQNWISTLWAEYYRRKSLITHVWDPSMYDFSSVTGPFPCTIPELIEEILG